MAKNSQVNVGIKFKSDTKEVENSLSKLKQSLQDLQKIKPGDFNGTKKELNEAKNTAKQVEIAMEKAFNPVLNSTNINTFKTSLKDAGLTVEKIKSDFAQFGVQGEVAFSRMTSSLLTTNLKLKQTNSLIDSMGKTMVNTVKWGIASSVMNTFTQSVQGAFQYVQSLEKSLTNIRIVTGDSTEKMAQFAEQANRSAQALGRSTLDYSKASLTFYQQGLNDEDVQARTEATLKAQNITGAGSQMADYLTSVWNGYKVANEEAELYVDKLAAVADSSASDMSQLAIAMSKVASTANTMGVDIDQLNAQIATVVATTRQAPESVGTAFKTIYTRMNDIKTGSDEAEISLGRYSGTMASLGFNVLDATGHLRDTGQVMEEIGGRWQDLTKEQQIYLAQTMGGQRQVNQLMALFDNWTTYSELLNTSLESEGTLAEKNSRYMESLGAKMEQFGAAGERVKAALINTDSLKTVIEGLTGVTNLIGNLFETMGNGNTVLLAFGSTLTQMFSGTIAKEISSIITNMQNVKYNAEQIKAELETTQMLQQVGGADTAGGKIVLEKMAEIQQYYSVMDETSINNQKNLIAERAQIQNQIEILKQKKQQVEDIQKAMSESNQPIDKDAWFDAKNNFIEVQAAIDNVQQSLKNVKKLGSEDLFSHFYSQDMAKAQEAFTASFEKFIEDYSVFDTDNNKASEELARDFENFRQGTMSAGAFYRAYTQAVQIAKNKTKELENTLKNGQSEFRNLNREAAIYDENIGATADKFKQLFDTTNAIKLVGAIGQIASTFMTLKNLGSIWQDKDVPTGEKIAKTLTTIGFALPTLHNSYKKGKEAISGIYQSLVKYTLAQKASAAASTQQATTTAASTAATAGQTTADTAEAGAATGAAAAEKAHAVSLAEVAATAGTAMLTLLPYVAVVGAIIAVGVGLYKAWNEQAEAAEKAAKTAQQAKENYDNLKESFKNLTSAITDYKDAKTALSELTTGTEEWYDAVNDLNDKVLELIDNFPELVKYLERTEDGVLSIDEQGFKEATQKARQKTYAAGLANANLQQDAYEAQRKSQIVNQSRRIYGGWGNTKGLQEAMSVMKDANFSNENELRAALQQSTSLTGNQIDATIENSGAIYKLIETLEAGEARVDALKDTYTRSILQNEESYKNSTNKEALADMVSAVVNEASSQLNDKYYNVNAETGQKELNTKLLYDRYSELTGEKIRGTGFLGNQKERQLEDGTWEKLDTDFVKAQVATLESLEDFSSKVENIAQRLENAEKNFAQVDERTKQLLFNSGLAGGFDKVNTDSLSQVDVNKLIDLNSNDLADFLGIDAKDIPDKLAELGTSVEEGLNSFINGIEEGNTRAVMTQLKDKYGSDLSRELAETIAQNVQDGYQKVGAESGNAIRDFYKKLSGDQVDDIAKLAEEYNYAGNSAEDFIKAVRETGVTSEQISDDMVKAFYDAQSKIQDVQTRANRLDLDKVNAGSGTAGLAQKVQNGEKLSDKELESMKEGLEDLKKVYPSLTKEVEILKNAQLSGTQSYQESLRRLKAALMASYEDMLKLKQVDYSQISDSLKGLIATTEDLQNARGRGLLTEETNSEIIINLASKYQSCKNQIEKYTLALQSNDEQLKFTQGLNLETALRSAELAQKYGLEANSVEELSRHYQQLWMQQGSNRQSIQKNAELATEAAVAYMRLNQGIEALQKSYSDVETVLNTLEQYDIEEVLGDADLGKKFEEIRKSVADLLNTSEDLIDSDFIKKYAKQIKSLANGSEDAEEALADLQKGIAELSTENLLENLGELGQEGLKTIKVDLDDDGFNETLLEDQNKLNEWLQSIPQGELSLNDLNAINSLINLMQQAGWSAAEIEQYFRNQNIDLDIMDAEAALATLQSECGQAAQSMAEALGINTEVVTEENKNTDVIQTPTQEGHWDPVPATFRYPVFSAVPAGPFGGVNVEVSEKTGEVVGQQWITKPDVEQSQASSSRTAVALSAVAGNKRGFGGGISHKNKTGGNKKSSGGGGKKGKGGGGKGSQPKQAKQIKPETKKADRYHDNTVKANKLANQLTKLNKQHERLTGKDALDNLKKQLDVLEKQNDNIKERIGLEKDELTELRNQLTPYGAKFNPDGSLANYKDTFGKIMDQYNKAMNKWNTASAEWQQENKDFADNAKKKMEEAIKVLEEYDKVVDKIAKSRQEMIDKAQDEINKKVQIFKVELQAELDLTNVRRDLNNFRKEFIEKIRDDDILGQNKFNFKDLSTYFNSAGSGSIQYLTDRLNEIMPQENFFSTVYNDGQDILVDDAARIEQIKNLMDKLSSEMGDFKEIVDAIKQSIFDAIDAAQEAFDEQMDEYEYLGDLLDHNQKITEMLFGDKAYDQMDKYYKAVEENNNKQLDFLSKQKDLWYGRMMEQQQRMDSIRNKNSNEYKQAEERFKEYEKHWMDSTKNLNAVVEDSLENILNKYANAIDKALLNLELKFGNGNTFDDIEDEWDRINDQADMYLDKINSAYEIDKLANAYQDAIKDNDGDIAAQQALNDLMEQQLAYLKDKDKLTQYDVDRANTLLQIEMKRLALEQARSNKNRLRLRRDSQGNYTYQYTADTESINKAEQELADAKVSLYNADKAAYVDNLNSIQKSAENIKSRLEDIWKDQNLSQEQKLKKSYELQKYYGDMINDLLADNASIRNNLINSAFEDIEKRFGITKEQFSQFSKEDQDKYLSMYIPQINSATAQLVDKFIGEGGIGGMFQDFIDEARQVERDKVNSISMLEQSQRQGLIKDYDTLTKQAEALLEDNDKLTQAQAKNLIEVQNNINAVNQLTKAYEGFYQMATKAYTEGAALLEKQDRKILGLTRTDENQARANNDDLYNTWAKKTNSGGDIPNYTPYQSEWSGTSYAALFGSTSIDQADYLFNKDKISNQAAMKLEEIQNNENLSQEEKLKQIYEAQKDYAIAIKELDNSLTNNVINSLNNDIFTSINNTLSDILKSNQEYYTKSLINQESMLKSIVANQNIHIDADFPNAKDVYNIIRAMEDLAAAAAQKAGSTTKLSTASGKVNAGKTVTVRKQKS